MVRLSSTYEQTAGFVYVLSNPSMPGIIKIGSTERTLKERVAELSSTTSLPTPFVIEYYSMVRDPSNFEFYLHEKFNEYRINEKREFFKIEVELATKIIQSIEVNWLIEEIMNLWSTEKEIEFITQYKQIATTNHFSIGVDETYEDCLISLLDEISASPLSKLKSALDVIYAKRPELYRFNFNKISEDLRKLDYKERQEFIRNVVNDGPINKDESLHFCDSNLDMTDNEIAFRLEDLFRKRPNIWKIIKKS